jgi:hypothetical protein
MKYCNITKDWIYMPLEFENFLSSVLTKKNYHWTVWHRTFSEWKIIHKKLINYLKSVIDKNIISDNSHIKQLEYLIIQYEENIKKSKTFDLLNVQTLKYLYMIIFVIIWDTPNNWFKKPQSKNKVFNKCRTIFYKQDIEQKIEVIQKEMPKYSTLSSDDIWEKRKYFWLNSEKFMKWFKLEYPKIYCELF